MPDQTPPRVSSDRVLEIIRQDAVGAYLLRAAIAEATCEAYAQRENELEQAKTDVSAAHALRPGDPGQF